METVWNLTKLLDGLFFLVGARTDVFLSYRALGWTLKLGDRRRGLVAWVGRGGVDFRVDGWGVVGGRSSGLVMR